jgi:insulysin
MKLEKYKNIREESAFFWGEISEGTLKFDRKEAEVCRICSRKSSTLPLLFYATTYNPLNYERR